MTKNDKNELSKYFSYFQINSQKSKYSLGYVAFDDPQSTLKSALQILNISYNFVDVLLIMVSQQSSSCSRLPKVVRSLVISRLYYQILLQLDFLRNFYSVLEGRKKGEEGTSHQLRSLVPSTRLITVLLSIIQYDVVSIKCLISIVTLSPQGMWSSVFGLYD